MLKSKFCHNIICLSAYNTYMTRALLVAVLAATSCLACSREPVAPALAATASPAPVPATTTATAPPPGTVAGSVAAGKDFGAGYAYDVIVEKATVTQNKAANN